MKHLLVSLFCILIITSCSNNSTQKKELSQVLESVANGEKSELLISPAGTATEQIRSMQLRQKMALFYDIRSGDAPSPIGDDSCNYHALISESANSEPFIGVRMRRKTDGWHIAGYWTPKQSQ